VQALDAVGVALLLACLGLLTLVVRRRVISRGGGTVEMSLRVRRPGGLAAGPAHWAFGLARYEHDRLLWFRTFSLSPRPRHALDRTDLRVRSRRPPHRPEAAALHADAVVLECSCGDALVDLAVPGAAAVGVLAWIEAAPTRSSAST
jgi:hypothetical protein